MAAPLNHVPPTTAAYVIATAIIAGVTGYFIGQGASLGLFREKQGWPNGYDVKVHKDSSDEEHDGEESEDDESDDEDEGNGEELAAFKDNEEEVKLVLVVRTDLGMTKGTCSTPKKRFQASSRDWEQHRLTFTLSALL
jgi:PTH2 family peptidyl-tRNA hydrolase